MVIKVEHPNGYAGVLYGKSSMAIYDKDGHEVLHTGFRTPNTKEELYETLEDMPRVAEMIAQIIKEDRKTEPSSSEKPNNCEDFFREPTAEERKAVADYIDSISVPTGVNIFDLMDEPTISKMEQVEDEPQTDCAWRRDDG